MALEDLIYTSWTRTVAWREICPSLVKFLFCSFTVMTGQKSQGCQGARSGYITFPSLPLLGTTALSSGGGQGEFCAARW